MHCSRNPMSIQTSGAQDKCRGIQRLTGPQEKAL